MNANSILKILAIFAMILLAHTTEIEANIRVLEESQAPNAGENQEKPQDQENRELAETPASYSQENSVEANAEVPKETEGRFLYCYPKGGKCTTRADCCSQLCNGVFCL